MQVFNWNDIIDSSKNNSIPAVFQKGTALSVGCFDGIHLGHSLLINSVLQKAKEKDLSSGIITFKSNNVKVVNGGELQTLSQKLKIFESKGLSFVVVIDFSNEFVRIEGHTFLDILYDVFKMRFIAEGQDFRFGYKGKASKDDIVSFAKSKEIEYDLLPLAVYEDERVSSSLIRTKILQGNFKAAEAMLSRPYEIDYKCVSSDGKTQQVLPPNGEYKVLVNKSDCAKSAITSYLKVEDQTLRQGLFLDGIKDIRTIEFISE